MHICSKRHCRRNGRKTGDIHLNDVNPLRFGVYSVWASGHNETQFYFLDDDFYTKLIQTRGAIRPRFCTKATRVPLSRPGGAANHSELRGGIGDERGKALHYRFEGDGRPLRPGAGGRGEGRQGHHAGPRLESARPAEGGGRVPPAGQGGGHCGAAGPCAQLGPVRHGLCGAARRLLF